MSENLEGFMPEWFPEQTQTSMTSRGEEHVPSIFQAAWWEGFARNSVFELDDGWEQLYYPIRETRLPTINTPRKSGLSGLRSAIFVSDEVSNWPISRDVNIDVRRLENDLDYRKMLHDIIILSILVPHRLDIPLWMVMSDVSRMERYMDHGYSKFRSIG